MTPKSLVIGRWLLKWQALIGLVTIGVREGSGEREKKRKEGDKNIEGEKRKVRGGKVNEGEKSKDGGSVHVVGGEEIGGKKGV